MPAAVGFILGALFIFGLDKVMPHLHLNFLKSEGPKSSLHRTTLLTIAIALHNIPEWASGGLFLAVQQQACRRPVLLWRRIIGDGDRPKNFPRELPFHAFKKDGLIQAKKLSIWTDVGRR